MSERTVQERLRRESARGSGEDGAECCYAPKWTCCDPALLAEAADRIDALEAEGARLSALWIAETRKNEALEAALENARRDLNGLCPKSDTGSVRKRLALSAIARVEAALAGKEG